MAKHILAIVAITTSLSLYAGGIGVAIKEQPTLSPAQRLDRVRAAARQLLEKNTATKNAVAQIKKAQSEIAQLEEKAGIPPIYEKLAKIRREACATQRKDPQIKQAMKKIQELRHSMTEKTSSEREQIEDLTQTIQETDDETEQKRLQAKIGVIEKNIKQKTGSEANGIKKLNRSIRTRMKATLDTARPILADLQKRYRTIEKNIGELDKRISDLVDDVENSLSEKGQIALETLRGRATDLQQAINKESPCPDTRSKERDWISYFI